MWLPMRDDYCLLEKIRDSGDIIDLSEFRKWSISKCSIGAPNNQLSIIVMPIIAAIGGKVADVSERRPNHYDSTIEKLETIPGYRAGLPLNNFMSQLRDVGISVIGGPINFIPRLYQPNDIEEYATLMMGKEMAKGSYNIIFDINISEDAPIKTLEEAKIFINKAKQIGNKYRRNVIAFISRSNLLGNKSGNLFETQEAIDVLNGKIKNGNLYNSSVEYAAYIACQLYNVPDIVGERLVKSVLNSGTAYERFKEWISLQGGDLNKFTNIPNCRYKLELRAKDSGKIIEINKEDINTAINFITKNSGNYAGIVFEKQTGDNVMSGDTICTIHANTPAELSYVSKIVEKAIKLGKRRKNIQQQCFYIY